MIKNINILIYVHTIKTGFTIPLGRLYHLCCYIKRVHFLFTISSHSTMEKIVFEFYDAENKEMVIAIWGPWYLKQVMTGARHIAWILSVDITEKERYDMNGMNEDNLRDCLFDYKNGNELKVQYVQ